MKLNRRNAPRYATDLQVSIHVDNQNYETCMHDISLGGVQIEKPSDCSFAENECYAITINDPGNQVSFGAQSSVVWSSDNEVGLKLTEVSSEGAKILNRLLSDLARFSMNNQSSIPIIA